MNSTLIKLGPEQRSDLARGHFVDGSRSAHIEFQAFESAGSLLSSTNELLLFRSANLGLRQVDLTPLLANMQVARHENSPIH